MTRNKREDYYIGLVRELCKLPMETEWVEFKHNDAEPQQIGEYISALANSAALNGKIKGYVAWGVQDSDHALLGTSFSPSTATKGNEPLETWLLRLTEPKIGFSFHELTVDGKAIVLLEIDRATHRPVVFSGTEFIRVGQVKKKLKDAPDRERELWRVFDKTPFEDLVTMARVAGDDVLRLLDYSSYFDLLELPLPSDREGILEALKTDELIKPNPAGEWDITNLGAILFAKNLLSFRGLRRKAMRVIQYEGTSRIKTRKEHVSNKGYASGFNELLEYVSGLIPANEVIGKALRRSVPMFPEVAVRELVANALIHQDLFETGSGPMVEIFDDRMEITNPGEPLVDVERFVDTPPKSRNEELASLMRRFGICEERGSGIDKVIFQVEFFQLPAPLFEAPPGATRSVLFAHKDLKDMDKADRVRACYLHACLKRAARQDMTNSTLRERFGIEKKNAATASRYIAEALEAKLIVIQDPASGKRSRRYLPFWA